MNILKIINSFNSCRKIIALNKSIFNEKQKETDSEILIEFNNFSADHIPYSYCANILKNKYNFLHNSITTSSLNRKALLFVVSTSISMNFIDLASFYIQLHKYRRVFLL